MAKGWLDNYGKQENYNNSKTSVPEGYEGEGYSMKGRNYSPAWGGQFQGGGKVNSSTPVIDDAGNYNEEGDWIPDWKTMTAQAKKLGAKRVKTKHGSLIVFDDNWEVVGVDDNPDEMQMGGSVYPVNYVPEAAMGGSIPGAVGFSYARTQSPAPSNGKYAKKTMASAQNGKEMQYYQNGLDFKPKSISKNGSWLSKYEGEAIKDDRGQWDHPGEITEIGSNEITMQGVPYNVLGVSDTGDTKLMKPGKNYKFKGKKVTEYPMAQNGLRQEQKGLQNLDNLTNFTNYNKPQPGGWLNKYN